VTFGRRGHVVPVDGHESDEAPEAPYRQQQYRDVQEARQATVSVVATGVHRFSLKELLGKNRKTTSRGLTLVIMNIIPFITTLVHSSIYSTTSIRVTAGVDKM
jgi:hypothetical protein